MPLAIECFFDAASEGQVLALWESLAGAGLPALRGGHGHRPHVSLSVAAGVDADGLIPALETLASEVGPVALGLGSVGVFPGTEGVVYLGAVVTQPLLTLHEATHTLMQSYGRGVRAYYAPGAWVPHCTVTIHTPADLIPVAVMHCLQHAGLPLAARVEALGLVETAPGRARTLAQWPLTGGDCSGSEEQSTASITP